MDAGRIRQAVETHGCDLRAKYRDEHRREEPDCAVCLIDTAALAYADLLDGPTDEMVERGRFPILDTTAMFASKMLGITHEAAMDREDIRQMATIVARAVLLAALSGTEEEE